MKLWAPAELAAALGASAPTATSASTAVIESVDVHSLPRQVHEALSRSVRKEDGVTVDRSVTFFGVLAACYDAGLTRAQAEAAVRTRADLAARLDEHPDDLNRSWLKIVDERQQRKLTDNNPLFGILHAQATVSPAVETLRCAEPSQGSPWAPVDLSGVVAGLRAGTLTRPTPSVGLRNDGVGLFYPRAVNGLAGASGSGKTWTALLSCAQQLAAGASVCYIDLESNAADLVARLLDLGVDPEDLLARFYYLNPDVRLDPDSTAGLLALVEDTAPTVVVIDSTGESMALEGDKPNDDDDCARWFRRLAAPIAKLDPAVVVIDHMAKADDGALWPIGSQRKRAAISGAQYVQTAVQGGFAKGQPGLAKLVCAKDRNGTYRQGQKVAMLDVQPAGGSAVRMTLRAPADESDHGGSFRPTTLMERISVLLEQTAEPMSLRAITKDAPINARAEDKTTALDVLVAEGYVSQTPGPRGAKLHSSARPYRQVDDPKSDHYEPGDSQRRPDRLTVRLPIGGETGDSRLAAPGDSRETVGDSRRSTLIGMSREEITAYGQQLRLRVTDTTRTDR